MTMIRTAEDTRYLFGHNVKPSLFVRFAHNCFCGRFAGVNRATRCTPSTVVTPFLQKNTPLIIANNRHHARIEN